MLLGFVLLLPVKSRIHTVNKVKFLRLFIGTRMTPNEMIRQINTFHPEAIAQWKTHPITFEQIGFLKLVEHNHAFNYQLWHEEDKARRDDMGFEFVYLAKRKIDHFNQQRNNYMEQMDQWLLEQLNPAEPALNQCPIHSETPGMMIDRLSILSLKQYHMALQTIRTDVDANHLNTCQQKLGLIEKQRSQLSACLQQFLDEITTQKRTFILYHQLKMYNDKTLNPELYQSASTTDSESR